MKYENELWGKGEFLHERYKKKHLYISNFIDIITKFQNSCLNFSKSLLLIISRKYQLLEEKDNSIYNTVQKLLSFIELQSQEYNELYDNIKTNILEPTIKVLEELNRKEKDLFNLYLKSKNQYINSKTNLEKAQKEYENSIKICEKVIHNAKISESNPLVSDEEKDKNTNKTNSFINNSKNLENKYFACVEEANKMRENEYKQEKDLLNFYQQIDSDNYNNIKGMIGIFLVFIKKMSESIINAIESLSNQYKNINIANDLNIFIQNNKSAQKPDEQIIFIPYSPEATLKTTSISGGDDEENQKLQINYEVISTLRKSFRNICQDLNMEIETQKNRLRILTFKVFRIGPNINFSEEEKNELLSYLKIPEFRAFFIINLSKQRTRGRYKRGEKLIEDLADILDFILKISEKENNFEDAKNCIILGQTFYSEIQITKDNNTEIYKRYLLEYIINNKWLKSIPFWEGIIDFMINKEIDKNKSINEDLFNNETLEERKTRISNIAFSQLLSYSNNMIDFYIKRDLIKNVIDLFVKKYNIEKDMAQMIYENLENAPQKPPILPIIRKNKKKEFKSKRKLSIKINRNFDFKNIELDFIENTNKKNKSVDKYKTKLKFEENKHILKRTNELSKSYWKTNQEDDDNDDDNESESISNKNSSNIDNNKNLIRKTSYEKENNNINNKYNFTSTISFDISNIKLDIKKNLNEEEIKDNNNEKIENNEKMENDEKMENNKKMENKEKMENNENNENNVENKKEDKTDN